MRIIIKCNNYANHHNCNCNCKYYSVLVELSIKKRYKSCMRYSLQIFREARSVMNVAMTGGGEEALLRFSRVEALVQFQSVFLKRA